MKLGSVNSDPRLKIAIPIKIEWIGQEGIRYRLKTFSDNISHSGVCFVLNPKHLHPSLNVSQKIKVIADQGKLSADGYIKHITHKKADTVWIGIELSQPIFRWLSRYRYCNDNLLREVIPTTHLITDIKAI
ncbi:MAG: hypothetical protein JNN15_14440 [Blastocatellia bacterium]|nr:hypothetical protein [Blastocatellia bacterium]